MVTVVFNPAGGPLSAKAIILGNMDANYDILLRERNSNAQTTLLSGDNLNPEDDLTSLPSPTSINEGRRVLLKTGFIERENNADHKYSIRLEIHQDGNILGFNTDAGKLNGKGQFSLLFIKLITQ